MNRASTQQVLACHLERVQFSFEIHLYLYIILRVCSFHEFEQKTSSQKRHLSTSKLAGGGLYQEQLPGEDRRQCRTYSAEERIKAGLTPFDTNPKNWRTVNPGIPSNTTAYPQYSGNSGFDVVPRECRPFPDYDPALRGLYDESATVEDCPACFLPDGVTRVPPQYYNRATWSTPSYTKVLTHLKRIFGSHLYTDKCGSSSVLLFSK